MPEDAQERPPSVGGRFAGKPLGNWRLDEWPERESNPRHADFQLLPASIARPVPTARVMSLLYFRDRSLSLVAYIGPEFGQRFGHSRGSWWVRRRSPARGCSRPPLAG